MALSFPGRVRDNAFTVQKPETKRLKMGLWNCHGVFYQKCKLSQEDNNLLYPFTPIFSYRYEEI